MAPASCFCRSDPARTNLTVRTICCKRGFMGDLLKIKVVLAHPATLVHAHRGRDPLPYTGGWARIPDTEDGEKGQEPLLIEKQSLKRLLTALPLLQDDVGSWLSAASWVRVQASRPSHRFHRNRSLFVGSVTRRNQFPCARRRITLGKQDPHKDSSQFGVATADHGSQGQEINHGNSRKSEFGSTFLLPCLSVFSVVKPL